ncbi:MAG: hypothetical protein ACTHOB_09620 [Ginsengibacter sp.]
MNADRFDQMLKKKLDGFASDVPGEMWERITSMKRHKKKPTAIFLIFISIIFLLFVTIGYKHFFIHSKNIENKTKTAKVIVEKKSAAIKNNETAQLSVKDSLSNSTVLATANLVTSKKSLSFTRRNKNTISSELRNLKNNYGSANSKFIPSIKEQVGKRDDTSKKDENIIDNGAPTTSSKKSLSNTDTTTSSENKEIPQAENNDKFSIELFASPVYPVNNIRSSNTAYQQLLKNSGTIQLSAAFGIRFRYSITGRISAKVGINYDMVNEKINFKNSLDDQLFKVIDKYRFLNVPLLISYKIKNQKPFSLSINTGVVLNVSSKYEGALPSIESEPTNIANVYYVNTGIGFYFSAAISKNIDNKTYLFAEPYLQYNVKNMTNSFQPFQQKFHLAGVNIGAGYRLFHEADK